jgi:two-component system OmpR family sensor kinase
MTAQPPGCDAPNDQDAGSMPPGQPLKPFARGSLGRRLLIRVMILVAVIAVLLSGATVFGAQRVLVHNVDQKLETITSKLRGHGQWSTTLLHATGQPIGTLYVGYTDQDRQPVDAGRLAQHSSGSRNRPAGLSNAVVTKLTTVAAGSGPRTMRLPHLGRYRVAGFPVTINHRYSGTLVVGVPLHDVDQLLYRIVVTALVVSLAALLAAAAGLSLVIRRSLAPLNRVAGTANQVSDLPLDRGDAKLPVRVPAADADPDNEVGRVGLALNHLLDNVGGALAARQASEHKLKQFVADASHELRNPLAAIRGYAELTRRSRDQLPSDVGHAMGRIESEAERMSRLVEDLLLLARLDSGPSIQLTDVDLVELTSDAVADARVAGPDHQWSLDVPGDPIMVAGDRHRLHQAVTNLLANARTHTPAGTTVRVGLTVDRTQADQPQVVITVADNGPGIPAEMQQQVFERFTRADSSRSRSGPDASTGLGLAIVAAVAAAHQGSAGVRSVGGDTRFWIRLPLGTTATHGCVTLP